MRIVSRCIEIVPGESTHPVQPTLLKIRLGLVDDHAFSIHTVGVLRARLIRPVGSLQIKLS